MNIEQIKQNYTTRAVHPRYQRCQWPSIAGQVGQCVDIAKFRPLFGYLGHGKCFRGCNCCVTNASMQCKILLHCNKSARGSGDILVFLCLLGQRIVRVCGYFQFNSLR